ncbi:MAG: hypothetical protein KAS32_18315 [Candidatus Peribacteraceae bacterium]|nr:hypothetical protein [Candidatus Peribacteraceae bacterium]
MKHKIKFKEIIAGTMIGIVGSVIIMVMLLLLLLSSGCNPVSEKIVYVEKSADYQGLDSATIFIHYSNNNYSTTSGPLTITQDNKPLFVYNEGDPVDTIKIAYEWTYFRWSRDEREVEKEIYPKNNRKYRVYGTTFYQEDD